MSRNEMSNSRLSLSDISTVLCHIDVFQQMQEFLGEILTPSEQRDLALRWELMRRLKKGVPQRQIAKELGISLCKITRGAKILKQDHSVSKHYLNAGETDESENLS
jgi:TrpR family trp operon transcriptional repressor